MPYQPSQTATDHLENRNIYATSMTQSASRPRTEVLRVLPTHTNTIRRGTVLGRYTAGLGPDTSYDNCVAPYDPSATNGLETAIGILDSVDISDKQFYRYDAVSNTDVPKEQVVAVIIPSNGMLELLINTLTGLDNDAITQLNGIVEPQRGVFRM